MKTQIFLIILAITLAACAPATTPVPTRTFVPILTSTAIPSTFTPTAEMTPDIGAPTPMPTQPIIPIITPNTIQVERWQEYEDALAKTFFSYLHPEEVVCEWEILGQADQEVYVYARCSGIYSSDPSQGSIPAVIHIGMDGSVMSAEIPGGGTAYASDIRRMFPTDVQEKIFSQSMYSQEFWNPLEDRLRWRRGHPEEPPLVVLNSLPTQPTQTVIPMITPDRIQVERWTEYQTALAKSFLSYLPPEEVICEWEILGQSGQEVYVWSICAEKFRVGTLEGVAIIHLGADGSVQNAETSEIGGIGFPSDIRRMFPLDVQERYFGGLIHFQELVDHLRSRQTHPEESPLVILSAMPTATPTP